MENTLYIIAKLLSLPPGMVGCAGLVAVLIYRWLPRVAFAVAVSGCVLTWLLATPAVSTMLARQVETVPPLALDDERLRRAEAIVVLGGGVYRDAPEFRAYHEVSRLTLERLRYAARLHRFTRIELAVTGGTQRHLGISEAELMRAVLAADFGVNVKWAEMESRTTAENAQKSAALFKFRRVVLVTHAAHMPRAMRAFERAGFDVVAAPLGFISRPQYTTTARDWLPDLRSFAGSHYAIYETIGALWYRLTAS